MNTSTRICLKMIKRVDASRTDNWVGLDIGASYFKVCVVDDSGIARAFKKEPTPHDATETGAWQLASRLLQWAIDSSSGCVAIGIASAGPIDRSQGTVSPMRIRQWRDFPIVERVSRLADLRPLLLSDGAAAARAEYESYYPRIDRPRNLAVVSMGTGVTAGVVLEGRLVHGDRGNAGLLGHVALPEETARCVCGAVGCVATLSSTSAIVRAASTEGRFRNVRDVVDAARKGDQDARSALERASRAVGGGIATLVKLFDVRTVVISGGVAQSSDVIIPEIEYALRLEGAINLRASNLDGRAAAIGAAVEARLATIGAERAV